MRSTTQLDPERRVQRLDHAFRAGEAALDDRAEPQMLVRGLLVGGEVDARDLEQRDRVVARVHVALRRVDEPVEQRRPQGHLIHVHRIDQPDRPVWHEAEGVRLRHADADEHVLAEPSQPLLDRTPPEHLAPFGQRERHLLEAVDADDLLDDVDLARDVAGAPGRDGDDAGPLLDLEAEPLEDPALVGERHVDARDGVGALGPQPRHGADGQIALLVDLAGPARLRQVDEQLGRVDRRLLRDVRVDALLPAVRTLGAKREPLRRLHDPHRLEVRRLEQDVGSRRRRARSPRRP